MIKSFLTAPRTAALLCAASLASLTAGCDLNGVKVYHVPKERLAAPMTQMGQGSMPGGMAGMGMPARPRLSWNTPEGWTELPASQMRAASFSIQSDGKQADVSVIPLGGGAGGDVANVNRWRGQVGLDALSAEELQKTAEKVEVAGETAELYDVAGTNPSSGDRSRILGVIQHRDGTAWFYKMSGDDQLVAQHKAAFVEFLKSVSFNVGEMAGVPHSHPPMDGGALPEGHPPIGGSLPEGHPPVGGSALPEGHPEIASGMQTPSMQPTTGASASSEGKPAWQVPSGWKEVPGGQFLVAKFMIGEGNNQAAVNVSTSAGDGGGFVGNVNRWRGQLGLSPLPAAEVNKLATSMDVASGQAMFVDMTGTDMRSGQPTRLIGAVIPRDGSTWFYKLMGDAKLVEGEKDAFTRFVQSVKH